jgi:hypothetical protein
MYIQSSGDFEEIYGVDMDPREPHSGQWDSVLTCFFIDTVSSPVYISGLGLLIFFLIHVKPRPKTLLIIFGSFTEY